LLGELIEPGREKIAWADVVAVLIAGKFRDVPDQATASGKGAERHRLPKATRRAAVGGRWQPSMTRKIAFEPLPASVLFALEWLTVKGFGLR
jgi:hypothetical protein